MSDFKGFVFQDPNKQDQVSELTLQFSHISTENESTRLNAFHQQRSPLAHRSREETQEKRIQKALELQKQQRQISIDKARQLALGDTNDSDDEEEDEEDEEHIAQLHKRSRDEDEEMEEISTTKLFKKNIYKKKNNSNKKKKNIYADQIMYAEYFEMMPSDLFQDWVMMICPVGKRCLVTSGGGQTIARSRRGHLLNRFQSVLPNGSSSNRSSDFCILDCVYDAVHWTFYVLDVMCWRGYPIYDCDTNFRHFWLQTRIGPHEFDRPDYHNQFYKFKPLKPVLTTELAAVVHGPEGYLKQQHDDDYPIDGLLFYHQQARYQGGSTPLVGWVPRDSMSNLSVQ